MTISLARLKGLYGEGRPLYDYPFELDWALPALIRVVEAARAVQGAVAAPRHDWDEALAGMFHALKEFEP